MAFLSDISSSFVTMCWYRPFYGESSSVCFGKNWQTELLPLVYSLLVLATLLCFASMFCG